MTALPNQTQTPNQTQPQGKRAQEDLDIPRDAILVALTDSRGTLTGLSASYGDIARHDPQALIGRPLAELRHDDTPPELAGLVEERLALGCPSAMPVKLRAADGRGFWVIEVTTPMPQGGRMLLQFRPFGQYLAPVQAIYKAARARPEAKPDAARSQLRQDLMGLGFAGFGDFCTALLSDDLRARAADLNAGLSGQVRTMEELAKMAATMRDAAHDLGEGFRNIRNEPVNMRILSNRLESGGASISMISQNYEMMAQEMGGNIDRLCSKKDGWLAMIWTAAGDGRMAVMAAELLRELPAPALAACAPGLDPARAVPDHIARLEAGARDHVRNIVQACVSVPELGRQLRRRINGLDVVKLLCRVENCRIGSRDVGLTAIIERLESFHSETDALLGRLSRNASHISQKAQTLI